MAHFYGSIHGNRGKSTRLGSKDSGMSAVVASWDGAVSVRAFHDEKTGADMVAVDKMPWGGTGESKEIYYGKIGKVI